MTPEELANLVYLRRARDMIDRDYARPLDVPTIAARAFMSPAHFSRKFRAAYGETPCAYRARGHAAIEAMPPCFSRAATRPRRTPIQAKPSRNEEAFLQAAE